MAVTPSKVSPCCAASVGTPQHHPCATAGRVALVPPRHGTAWLWGQLPGTLLRSSTDPAQLPTPALGLGPVFAEQQNLGGSNCLFAPCN